MRGPRGALFYLYSMENANAFKHFINQAVIQKIGSGIRRVYPDFPVKKFSKVSEELEPLELKQRVLLVTKNLREFLPDPYPEALKILMTAMEKEDLKGFELWPFSEYISQFGLDHYDESMKAMYKLTQRFTSEFAVRPFLLKNHVRVLKYFRKWASDKNVHVRRWVSEGSRPLLPWGQKLPLFIMDPTHGILLLEKLKFDEELYVRKSVANHLNDISKNHPQVVINVLKLWEDDAPEEHKEKLNWIKRHALRTLIKKGHPGALKLMGAVEPKLKVLQFKTDRKNYSLNDTLKFSLHLHSTSQKSQKLIVDYAIDFRKANGKLGKKVFKLKTLKLDGGESIKIEKKHSLKPITTMKFYDGIHHLTIQINGKVMGEVKFNFKN